MTNGDHASHLARKILEATPWLGKPSASTVYAIVFRTLEDAATSRLIEAMNACGDKDREIEQLRTRVRRYQETIEGLQIKLDTEARRLTPHIDASKANMRADHMAYKKRMQRALAKTQSDRDKSVNREREARELLHKAHQRIQELEAGHADTGNSPR